MTTLAECALRYDREHARGLRALAYRMLGSRSEAEDIVQEAWLRWAQVDERTVEHAGAYLSRLGTNLGLDELGPAAAKPIGRRPIMSDTNAQPRLMYQQQSPELVRKLADLNMAIANSGHVETGLGYLVDIRASQMNGCAFCLDMHVKEAKLHGERELRLYHVAIWRESPLFTPKERAALAWTEALTQIASTGISDELYAEVREQFSEKELSTLTFRVMVINAWNRANIAFRTTPGSRDHVLGLDKAGLV
jgi:AhpD family alkylhydroperoxidase